MFTEEALTTIDLQIEKLDRIISDNPDDISVNMAIAEFHLRRGRHLEALQAYQKVVNMKENVHKEVDVHAHLGLAKIFMLQKMNHEAYKELIDVFELAPRSVEGRVLYNWLLNIEEPPADTKDTFRSLWKDEPELEDLKVFRHQKELESVRLSQEISQLEKIMTEHDGEPIYEYNYEMAILRKKHIEEMIKYIDVLEAYIEQKAEEQKVRPTLLELMPVEEILTEEKPAQEEELFDEEPPKEYEEEQYRSPHEEVETPEAKEPPFDYAREIQTESEPAAEDSPEQEEALPFEDVGTERVEEDVDLFSSGDLVAEESITLPIAEAEEMDRGAQLQEEELDELLTPGETVEPALQSPETMAEDLEQVEVAELPEEVEEKPFISETRRNFYESIKEPVTTVLAGLIKTKGVTVVMTIAGDGVIIDSIINEPVEHEEISEMISSGVELIREFRQDEKGRRFLYWVLEFEQGLLVLRSIDSNHFLLALAKAGANFGAMRYSMEKGKETLDDILVGAPPDLFD